MFCASGTSADDAFGRRPLGVRRPNDDSKPPPHLFSRKTDLDGMLVAMALRGPTSRGDMPVGREVGTSTLRRLVDRGILARSRTRPRRYALNEACPFYSELATLLVRLAGARGLAAPNQRVLAPQNYLEGARNLFGGERATVALLQLATEQKRRNEILEGQVGNHTLARTLGYWEQSGVLRCERPGRKRTVYSLNEAFPAYRELLRLLRRINTLYPDLAR